MKVSVVKNISHTLGYSLVALQEMNLAYKYPVIYWNTACLIVNSGSIEADEDSEEDKKASSDYGKMAQALGSTIGAGIKVSLIDINKSDYSFIPDAKNNQILFGLKGLLGVGDDIIKVIIQNRPYVSPKDFYQKVKPKKPVMLSLIKSGAFDNMEERKFVMAWYLWEVCNKKNRLTLQNMSSLLKYNLVPNNTKELQLARRVYEFNRYLKAISKNKAKAGYYLLDERATNFLIELDLEELIADQGATIEAKAWDKVYQKYMDTFRDWLAQNKDQILLKLNSLIFKEEWDNYASGNYSNWEMQTMCFYYHDHELKNVNKEKYGFSNYFELPEQPVVTKVFARGKLFQLTKICGTCIDKNKQKGLVTLLTPEGVVTVRFGKEYFSMFDKRISEDGHIVEDSWFTRGSMIVVQGMRSEQQFIAKKYASTGGHQLYKIKKVFDDGTLELQTERYKGDIE